MYPYPSNVPQRGAVALVHTLFPSAPFESVHSSSVYSVFRVLPARTAAILLALHTRAPPGSIPVPPYRAVRAGNTRKTLYTLCEFMDSNGADRGTVLRRGAHGGTAEGSIHDSSCAE